MEDLALQPSFILKRRVSAKRRWDSGNDSPSEVDFKADTNNVDKDVADHDNDLMATRPLVRVTMNNNYEPLVATVSQCSEDSSVVDCVPRTVSVPNLIPPNELDTDDFPDDESGAHPMHMDQTPSLVSSFSMSVSDDDNSSMYATHNPNEIVTQGKYTRIDDTDSMIQLTPGQGESTCSWQESMCDATTDVLSVGATVVNSIITFMNVDCITGDSTTEMEDKTMDHDSISYGPSEASI